MMIWLAHAGEEHVSNNDSMLHFITSDFIKITLVTIVFVSIIIFLAYLSQQKQPKNKEQADE